MKKKNKKEKTKLILLILLVCITLGYAALRTGLNINGTANVSRSSWNVHFENYQMSNATNITPTTEPTIIGNTTTSISYEVDLDEPGDLYEFSVEVVNGGSLDALISLVSKYNGSEIGPGNTIPEYIEYTVTDGNGDPIVDGHRLDHGNREIVKVFVKYRDDDASVLPGTDAPGLSFDIEIEAVQAGTDGPTLAVGTVVYYDPVTTNTCDESTYDASAVEEGTSTCYKWNVINSSGGNVEILLDRAIGQSAWVTDADYGNPAQSDKGPITALRTLKSLTDDWTRVGLLNYSQDLYTSSHPTAMRTPGPTSHYDSITCTNGTCVNDNSFQIVTGLRARLITAGEIINLINNAIDYEATTLSVSETWGIAGGYASPCQGNGWCYEGQDPYDNIQQTIQISCGNTYCKIGNTTGGAEPDTINNQLAWLAGSDNELSVYYATMTMCLYSGSPDRYYTVSSSSESDMVYLTVNEYLDQLMDLVPVVNVPISDVAVQS